jgi:hypothetical protein
MADVVTDAIEIVEAEADVIEITDAGITPGPAGQTGLIDVLYGTGAPPDPTGLAEGTLYIRYV